VTTPASPLPPRDEAGNTRKDSAAVRTGVSGRWAALGQDPERGSGFSVLAAGLLLSSLLMMGLVVDGGAKASAINRADGIAQEAARAGVQAASFSGAATTVDVTRAVSAAQAYLVDAGISGTVTSAGLDSITVTVAMAEPTKVLALIGINDLAVSGTATGRIVYAGS
jgi:hypothetical protein